MTRGNGGDVDGGSLDPSDPAGQLATHIHAWLHRDAAATDLETYFRDPTQAKPSEFSGRWFERLDGGGDRPPNHNHFTAGDLLAVEMLSVQVPTEASVQILHGRVGRTLSVLLAQVPIDVHVDEPAAAQLVTQTSAASTAWATLDKQTGIGWVTAGKLLARKRPHLLPVYDAVVKCALGSPTTFWAPLQAAWSMDTALRARTAELRELARVPAQISDLRIMDVVIWMGHHNGHKMHGCAAPGLTSLRKDVAPGRSGADLD